MDRYVLAIDGKAIGLTCRRMTAVSICRRLVNDGAGVRLMDANTDEIYFSNYEGDKHGN